MSLIVICAREWRIKAISYVAVHFALQNTASNTSEKIKDGKKDRVEQIESFLFKKSSRFPHKL